MFRKKTFLINLGFTFFSVIIIDSQACAQIVNPAQSSITTVFHNLPGQADTAFISETVNNALSNKIISGFYKIASAKKQLFHGDSFDQTKFNLPAGIITLNIDTTSTTCGKSNGTIIASASGGVPPYTYSYTISGNIHFQNTGNFQNLVAGSYRIVATDANGLADTTIVNLSNNSPAPFAAVSSFTDPSTCSTFDGVLTITASNGTPPYQYSFDNVNYQPGNVFKSLTQGLYSMFVKDANGCVSENYTNYLYPKVSCFGIGFYYSNFECNNNGTITIGTVLGGTPPFLYSLDGINYQPDNNFYNIGAGVHNMYTKDATGLVSIYAVTTSPLCPVNVTYVATDASCNQNDAILTLTAAFGNSPYAYTLDGINYQDGNTFTGLLAGNYTFTVKDANGVTFSGYATIKSKCPIVFASQTDPTCGRQDGTITATGYNGTSPYQFSIDGVNFQNSNIFTGLSAGNYIITIKDAEGFTDTTSVIINGNCFVLAINITNTICGNAGGGITVSASNGTPPYQFSLDGNNFKPTTTFNNLSAGSYTIYAKDAANVMVDSTVIISDTPGPKESVILTQGSCNNPKGNINIVTTGGTSPVQFSIDGNNYQSSGVFNNLDPGEYITYVKDTNGCISSDTVRLIPDGCGLIFPNAFSPNGDGLNDIFRIKYPFAVKSFSLTIYNRLGEKMFETSNMAKGWDGMFKGIKQPVDVYVWIVHITSLNNIKQTIKGIVTLLK